MDNSTLLVEADGDLVWGTRTTLQRFPLGGTARETYVARPCGRGNAADVQLALLPDGSIAEATRDGYCRTAPDGSSYRYLLTLPGQPMDGPDYLARMGSTTRPLAALPDGTLIIAGHRGTLRFLTPR